MPLDGGDVSFKITEVLAWVAAISVGVVTWIGKRLHLKVDSLEHRLSETMSRAQIEGLMMDHEKWEKERMDRLESLVDTSKTKIDAIQENQSKIRQDVMERYAETLRNLGDIHAGLARIEARQEREYNLISHRRRDRHDDGGNT